MKILDVCCGSKMMWFDEGNNFVVYGDKRLETHVLCDGRKLNIVPSVVYDFGSLPFQDCSFDLVVFDPPHMITIWANSWMAKKYGRLLVGYEELLSCGFNECLRVLSENGTLIFKWNEVEISIKKVISILGKSPLFGHKSGKQSKTHWLTFSK